MSQVLRLARTSDIDVLRPLMDRAIRELLRPYLDDSRGAALVVQSWRLVKRQLTPTVFGAQNWLRPWPGSPYTSHAGTHPLTP
jgi:hypothetical protein